MLIAYGEWIQLLRRLMDNGMVTLVSTKELPHWRSQPVTAGLFGVAKIAGRLRLIVERRWQDALECDLLTALCRWSGASEEETWTAEQLSCGGMWSEMVLAPSDRLSVNLDDLWDYYHLLRWPGPLQRWSALGPALRPKDLEALGLVVSERPCPGNR